jgi:hypothetical protein
MAIAHHLGPTQTASVDVAGLSPAVVDLYCVTANNFPTYR